MEQNVHDEVITVIGGTGALGSGLVNRLSKAGLTVIIGSRSPRPEATPIPILHNVDACAKATICIIAVPYSAYEEQLNPLIPVCQGKIMVSTGVPFPFPSATFPSAAEHAASLLPMATLVGALHTVSSATLTGDEPVDEDTICCGNDREAVTRVMNVLRFIPGLHPLVGGNLLRSRYAEAATHMLIGLNKEYHRSCGLRIVPIAETE